MPTIFPICFTHSFSRSTMPGIAQRRGRRGRNKLELRKRLHSLVLILLVPIVGSQTTNGANGSFPVLGGSSQQTPQTTNDENSSSEVAADPNNYCGTSWSDAYENCALPCPSGSNSDCAALGDDYTCHQFTTCHERTGSPSSNPTAPNPTSNPTAQPIAISFPKCPAGYSSGGSNAYGTMVSYSIPGASVENTLVYSCQAQPDCSTGPPGTDQGWISVGTCPSSGTATSTEATQMPTQMPTSGTPPSEPTLLQIASTKDDFSLLMEAIAAADLVDALSGDGPFTVFAPNDAAFEALGADTLASLLADPDRLSEILTYHVLSGKVMAADVTAGAVPTLNGADVDIVVGDDGSVRVNDANVITTDTEASNGVIHAIDAVLLLPERWWLNGGNTVECKYGNDYPLVYITDPAFAEFVFDSREECCAYDPDACDTESLTTVPSSDAATSPTGAPSSLVPTYADTDTPTYAGTESGAVLARPSFVLCIASIFAAFPF